MENKEPILYYDTRNKILYIDKETYDRDVMLVKDYKDKEIKILQKEIEHKDKIIADLRKLKDRD